MERRVTSHTEEEEMNQRRRLLTLARKGDLKAVELLFELYQVRVFSGDALKKKKLPSFPVPNSTGLTAKGGKGIGKSGKKMGRIPTLSSSEGTPKSASDAPHKSKKKSSMPATKLGRKLKGSKPAFKKPKKGRSLSSPKATPKKAGGNKRSATIVKTKQKTSLLSGRSARAKKK